VGGVPYIRGVGVQTKEKISELKKNTIVHVD